MKRVTKIAQDKIMLRRNYRLMKYKVSSSSYYHNLSIAETCLKLLKIAKRLKKKSSYKYVVIIVLKSIVMCKIVNLTSKRSSLYPSCLGFYK